MKRLFLINSTNEKFFNQFGSKDIHYPSGVAKDYKPLYSFDLSRVNKRANIWSDDGRGFVISPVKICSQPGLLHVFTKNNHYLFQLA